MNDLLQTDESLIWHPFTPLVDGIKPILIKSGDGAYLCTSDGRRILDAVSSWWVNLHGHANPIIAKAVADQANTLEHVIFAGFTHEPAITLAKNLMAILPVNQSKIFFSDNGSTAVEVALKMAFQYWSNQGIEKKKVIALDGAYHGDTFGAMSVGERGMFSEPFSRYLFDVLFIDFPSPNNEVKVIEQFTRYVETGEVGVFIFEPLLQGAGGMRMYSPDVLDTLLKIAKAHGVICIADEVLTGFGRTGKMFASHYLQEMPDIMALSKGLTGGTMPMGITSCSDLIVDAFRSADFTKTFFHGHSYTANPLACAAANASYLILISEECQQQIRRISNEHERFRLRISTHPKVKAVRSLGTILALELATKDETSYANELRRKVYPFFLERDILLRPLGNTLYILAPYIITDAELDKVYTCIEEFLSESW